ncbi:MAG: hypothetical protein IT303_16145 [Dehalococcoidia bacterium]|nr:hypothetical protein [Dehalococcoidia bacterium]
MTDPMSFPGGMSEIEFVDSYARSALRKPQMAADAALRALVFAEAGDRAVLAGLIGQELAEACRRLVAVHGALSDRRYSVGRSLLRPLPGVAEWRTFIQQAATFTPEQMVRELSLPEDALSYAKNLRGQPDLHLLEGLVAAAASGNSMLLIPSSGPRNVPSECWFAGLTAEGEAFAASFGVEEVDAANLADLTADLCGIARGFLNAYLGARRGAGRRD